MKWKLIVFTVIFAMLASLSPAVAADEMSVTATVEEILNEYHQKAFNAQLQDNAGTRSTYSHRGGEEKTLEQETVSTLRDAGYEAYNVTAANYDEMEDELKTDFAEMGLDSGGSYILVIEGENKPNKQDAGANTRTSPDIDLDGPDWPGGSSTFTYYDGETIYTMRYVTITSDDAPVLYDRSIYTLSEVDNLSDYVGDVFNALASMGVDAVAKGFPVSTVVSFLADWTSNEEYIVLDPEAVVLHASTDWMRSYIQVWDELTESWRTSQCSSYAVSQARCNGYVNKEGEVGAEFIDTGEVALTTYSPYYNNLPMRKARAVEGYKIGTKLHDCTGNIGFYFCDEDGVSINSGGTALFYHTEDLSYLLPYIQYD